MTEIPAYVPGEPAGLAALRAAESVEDFLDELADLYGVKDWSRREFMRAYVTGALEGWNPDVEAVASRGMLRIVSRQCPVKEEASADPRICHACQAFQEATVRMAMRDQVADVHFPRILLHGAPACEMVVTFREGESGE